MAVKRRAFKSHHYQRRIAPGRGARSSSCALALLAIAGSMLAAAAAAGYSVAQVVT